MSDSSAGFRDCLGSWAQELLSKNDRIRHLIGDEHWLSDGHHKEDVIREFLRQYAPVRFSIKSGFVKPPDFGECCSPETDILISDSHGQPPYFSSESLAIVPPSSVVGYIESKSTFDATSVRKAVANQLSTQYLLSRYLSDSDRVWRGAIFASAAQSRSIESVMTTFVDVVTDVVALFDAIPKKITSRPAELSINLLPNWFATYDRFIVFVSGKSPTNGILRGFDIGNLAFAGVVADLFSRLTTLYESPVRTDIATLLEKATESVDVQVREFQLK